ncbi:MAG: WD40 repeat domain-containing protein [Anaerolineales bacterium]
MKSNSLLRALFLLFGLVFLVVGAVYWLAPFQRSFKFSTAYSTNVKPAPIEDPNSVIEVSGVIRSFDITNDGSRIAIATSKEVVLYDLKTLKEIHNFSVSEKVIQARFSPDGSKLAVSGIILKYFESGPLHITVWDTASWKLIYKYESETDVYDPAGAIAWSPDGEQVAFSMPERGLSVIDINTGEITATLDDLLVSPFDFSWSPDGSRIITTGDLGYGLRRWRLDNNKWVRLWNANIQPAQQVKWSPDGKQIASGNFGGTVCVWNTGNNQCEGFIRAHFNTVDALDWFPQSGKFATASGAIRVWDSHTGEMMSTFGFYDGIIYKELRWFNPQTIATLETSYTKNLPATIRFWDVSIGDVKLAFRGWDDAQSANGGGMTLKLDDMKISNDQSILQVSLLFDTPDISLAGDWTITMTDSQGRIYPLTNIIPEGMDTGQTHIYQTVPAPIGERITLELKSFPPNQGLPFMQDFFATPGVFTFDPQSLKVGESITLDEIVDTGFPLRLTRAQKTSTNELLFEFDSEQYYTGVMLSSPTASGSSFGNVSGNKFTSTISFSEMPEEPVQIQVTRLYYNVNYAWFFDFRVAKSMFTYLPPAAPVSIPTPQPETAFTSQDPLFLEAQSLAEKFSAPMLNNPGWVRVVSETVAENIQPGQNYPPPYYKEEQWFEVDSQGWVTRSLTTDLDKDNNILQQSVSVGTHNMNLTTGEAMEFPIYSLSLDWFLRDLDYALSYGQTVLREETTCEGGSPCLLVTVNDGNFSRRAWINMVTGQQVKLQTAQQMPDGTETILFTQTFLLVERMDVPPQKVLDTFSKILFP